MSLTAAGSISLMVAASRPTPPGPRLHAALIKPRWLKACGPYRFAIGRLPHLLVSAGQTGTGTPAE